MNTYCNIRVERWVAETIPQPRRSAEFAGWVRRLSLAEICENGRRLPRRAYAGEGFEGVQRISTVFSLPRDVQDRIDEARETTDRFSLAALVCRCFARYPSSIASDEDVTDNAAQSKPEQACA